MPETLFQLAEMYCFSHSNSARGGLLVWCIYTNDFSEKCTCKLWNGGSYIGKSFYVP